MAIDQPFTPKKLKDFLFSFGKGMHNGIAPSLLPKDQLSIATNATVRGSFIRPRPAFRKIALNFADTTTQANFEDNLYQGACDFHPDALSDCLVASISGRIFSLVPDSAGNATVVDVSIAGDLNNATAPQAWMWQGEKWLFINNGVNGLQYFDGTTTKRNSFAGYQVVVKNLTDTATTEAAGTSILVESSSLSSVYGDLHIAGGFPPNTTNVFTVVKCSHPAAGTQLIAGQDLWTVVSSSDVTVPSFHGPVVVTLITATNVYAVASGTTYLNGSSLFLTAPSGGLASALAVPAIGASTTARWSAPYNGQIGGTVFIGTGAYEVTGNTTTGITLLPGGKMGAYVNGRNWEVLTDGRSYIGSDLVGTNPGGGTGTANNNFLDAILGSVTNTQIASGGSFFIPGQRTDIRAILGIPTLDAALGQGPVQIFTPNTVFSCNAPVDFDTNNAWKKLTYPIQSVTGINFGGLSQWSTISWNTDTLSRDVDGIRSTILARRDFNVWGETSVSYEVDPIISTDNQSLLNFCSAIIFDKRALVTCNPVQDAQGVYFTKLVAINSDTLSAISGKEASVYDGQWDGLNILQLVTGLFNGTSRAFAFTLNTVTHKIELWELMKSYSTLQPTGILADNNNTPIPWSFETPVLDFGQKDPRIRELLRLINGEIYVDQMVGMVRFQVYYKPDDYPDWTLWYEWQDSVNTGTRAGTAQFRPRMGLGEPSPNDMDFSTNRPLREAYLFQLKIVIIGQCRFKGGRFEVVTIPQPEFAPPATETPDVTPPMSPQQIIVVVSPSGREVYSGAGSPLLGTAVPNPGTPKTQTAIWIQTDSVPPMQITAIWANGIWQ